MQDAVDNEGEVGLTVSGTGDAANTERAITRLYRVDEGHAGGHIDKVFSALHTHVFDLAFRKRGDGGRYVLQ